MMRIVYGPKWPFYSCRDYIALFGTGICRFCIWVELPVQRRLCPIFVRNVGSPDIHECFRGLTGSQRTLGFGASHYQLDISLVEVCFIYTLKLRHGGRLSMSAQSPRLQFVTRLPYSPKTEAKGVILVRGP